MSNISKFFEKPFLVKMKDFFISDTTKTISKKKSEEFEENSFSMVDPIAPIENYMEINFPTGSNKNISNSEIGFISSSNMNGEFSTISLYENEYSDFVILEFGDAKIITKEEWLEIFKRKNLQNISHKDLYVSLQKGINFLM